LLLGAISYAIDRIWEENALTLRLMLG